MRLQDKIAIVTGAGSGFGEGIATLFAAEGATVVVNDLRAAEAEKVAAAIVAEGGRAVAQAGDVSKQADWVALVKAAEDNFGGLDIMVNNAGVPQRNMPMTELDETSFDLIFAVNVKSIYWSAKIGLPALRRRGGGAIVNTSSTAALSPRPGVVWYNGSKGAVNTITKGMAVELAKEKIRVNAVCPVAGDTPMLPEFMGGEITDKMRAAFLSTIPMGRFSTPRDIANATLFLASDDADMITGVCLEVDGGRCV